MTYHPDIERSLYIINQIILHYPKTFSLTPTTQKISTIHQYLNKALTRIRKYPDQFPNSRFLEILKDLKVTPDTDKITFSSKNAMEVITASKAALTFHNPTKESLYQLFKLLENSHIHETFEIPFTSENEAIIQQILPTLSNVAVSRKGDKLMFM